MAELAQLEAYLAEADQRRTWLRERIAAGDQPRSTTSSSLPGSISSVGTQKLLLGLGGLLLSLAGLVFTAVAWAALSGVGKVAVLVVAGAAVAAVGLLLRRRLLAAAETLVAAGLSLVATAGYAAPAVGAVGHGWAVSGHLLYVTACSAGLVLIYAALAVWIAMRAPVTATAAASVVTATSAGLYAVERTGDPLGFTAATAMVATVVALVAARLRDSAVHRRFTGWGSTRLRRQVGGITTAVVALLLAAAVASLFAWVEDPERIAVHAVALAGFAVLTGVLRSLHPRRVSRLWASVAAAAFAASALTLVLAGQPTMTGPSLACVLLAGGLLVWALHAPIAATRVRREERAAMLVAAAVLAVGGLAIPAVVGASFGVDRFTAVLLAGAVGLLGAGCTARPMPVEARGGWIWTGATLAVAAWLVFLARRVTFEPERLELFTAPAAALLAGCGLLWARLARRDGHQVGSVPTLLPGLLTVVVPGAVAGMDVTYDGSAGPALLRSLVFGFGGALMLVTGARLRVAALVLAGTVAVGLSTLGHLVAFGQQVPQWVVLAASGALLLTVGMRWEWLRTRQTVARTWVGSLR